MATYKLDPNRSITINKMLKELENSLYVVASGQDVSIPGEKLANTERSKIRLKLLEGTNMKHGISMLELAEKYQTRGVMNCR